MKRIFADAAATLVPGLAGFMATAWTERVIVPIAVAIIAATPSIIARRNDRKRSTEHTDTEARINRLEGKVDLLVERFIPEHEEQVSK